jgi:hypothetical protein
MTARFWTKMQQTWPISSQQRRSESVIQGDIEGGQAHRPQFPGVIGYAHKFPLRKAHVPKRATKILPDHKDNVGLTSTDLEYHAFMGDFVKAKSGTLEGWM